MTHYGLLKLLTNEIKYGAHITALIGPSLMIVISILKDLQLNVYALALSYIIPLIVYTYDYQIARNKDVSTNKEKHEYLNIKNKVFPIIIIAYIAISIVLIMAIGNNKILLFILIIIIGGILYTTIFKVLTRYIPGFKSIYATGLWTYFGTFFCVFLYSMAIDLFIIFILIFMFIKLFANSIFFDIKDIESDGENKLKTIPIILGKDKTIKFINFINILSLITLIVGIWIGALPIYAIALSVFFIYTYYYSNKGRNSDKSQLLKHTYITADAEYFFWPIVLIISKIIYIKFI